MAALISLAAGKAHLKIPAEETRDDAELTTVIAEASDVIEVYLKRAIDAPVWDETTCPPRIRAAVKLMLGYLWTARDDQEESEQTWKAITALLERDRDPALA
jgi:Phage gp6-like head-tail connector protein